MNKKMGKEDEADVGPYYINVVEELSDFKDWCISETNVWGIPIPYFKYKSDNEKLFLNSETIDHVKKLFE